MVQAVIFDLDGTLLNTLDDLCDCVNYALAKNGLPLRSREKVRDFVGNGVRKLVERAVPAGTDKKKTDEVFSCFCKRYRTHSRVKTKPYAGIENLLRNLSENGVAMAIVSNKSDSAVRELAEYFFSADIKVAIGEREGIEKKPAPDSVNEALRLLGVDREETVLVGDSEIDAKTAKNAGVDCILVTWGFRDEEILRKENPLAIVHTPAQLKEAILKHQVD